jgi:hypothetical protein
MVYDSVAKRFYPSAWLLLLLNSAALGIYLAPYWRELLITLLFTYKLISSVVVGCGIAVGCILLTPNRCEQHYRILDPRLSIRNA